MRIATVSIRHPACDSGCFPAAAAHHFPLWRGVNSAPHQHVHGSATHIAFFSAVRSWRITAAQGTPGRLHCCLALFAFLSCFAPSRPLHDTRCSRTRSTAFLLFCRAPLLSDTRSEDRCTAFACFRPGYRGFSSIVAALFAARGVAAL